MTSLSIETLGPLKRRLGIHIPAEKVKVHYDKQLGEMAKTAKIPGFRPGKVAKAVIRQRYGKQMLQEVGKELLDSTWKEALKEHHLEVVGAPDIKVEATVWDQPIEAIAEFEIYPHIVLQPMSDYALVRYHAKVREKEVDQAVESMRKRYADWVTVERHAKQGDTVTIDFEGRLDGELFDGGSELDFTIELGSHRLIDGFEKGVEGMSLGETREVPVTFPDPYTPNVLLAGKEGVFKITLKEIKEIKLPDVNEEWIKQLGFESGDVMELRALLEKNIQKDVDEALAKAFKQSIFDALSELNKLSIEFPDMLLKMELDFLENRFQENNALQAKKQGGAHQLYVFDRVVYLGEAKKRVQSGLLLKAVIEQYNIQINQKALDTKIYELASTSSNPKNMIKWIHGNERILSELQTLLLEDAAVKCLSQEFDIRHKTISYDEAMNKLETRIDKHEHEQAS